MDCTWIQIRGEWDNMVVDLDPFFELVDQDKPFAWRFPCRQQNRMVPAGVGSGDRAGGKSASPVRLKPFQTQGSIQIPAIFDSYLHASPLTVYPDVLTPRTPGP
jgi:hypothetical protein